jgi:hypothetical protein
MGIGWSDRDRIAAAVFNNAVWCDAVCQALGCDTDFVDDLWINSGTSPPFYPNAITLTRAGSEAQERRIGLIVDAGLPAGWSVKDAFATLELGPRGFRVLFEAEWLALAPARALPRAAGPALAWEPVTTEQGLAAWEVAWREGIGDALRDARTPRVFDRALLDDPDIVLLGARQGERVAGVAVANRSDDGSGPVAGISNLVLPEPDGERHRADAVAAVRSTFPDLPVVCYERGADLAAMVALGFERLGPLRTWVTG